MEQEKIFEADSQILHFAAAYHFYLCDDYRTDFVIKADGISYPSVRHVVVSLKTDSVEKKERIARILLASDLKDCEQSLPAPSYWTEEFVLKSLHSFTLKKFIQRPDLGKRLWATSPKELRNGLLTNEGRYDILHEIPVEENYYGEIVMDVRRIISFGHKE